MAVLDSSALFFDWYRYLYLHAFQSYNDVSPSAHRTVILDDPFGERGERREKRESERVNCGFGVGAVLW